MFACEIAVKDRARCHGEDAGEPGEERRNQENVRRESKYGKPGENKPQREQRGGQARRGAPRAFIKAQRFDQQSKRKGCDEVDEIMFAAAHGAENREKDKKGDDGAFRYGETTRKPPGQQNPAHVKRRNGVSRSGERDGFNEEAMNGFERNWMPRKIAAKDMDWSHRGQEVVEENSDGAGDEKGEHRGDGAGFALQQVP